MSKEQALDFIKDYRNTKTVYFYAYEWEKLQRTMWQNSPAFYVKEPIAVQRAVFDFSHLDRTCSCLSCPEALPIWSRTVFQSISDTEISHILPVLHWSVPVFLCWTALNLLRCSPGRCAGSRRGGTGRWSASGREYSWGSRRSCSGCNPERGLPGNSGPRWSPGWRTGPWKSQKKPWHDFTQTVTHVFVA